MTNTNITTAGIDTSKAKLDVAVHNRTERWQVANTLSGWRVLATNLAKAAVTRVGIEATGGYERGVVEHLRAAGFIVGADLAVFLAKHVRVPICALLANREVVGL